MYCTSCCKPCNKEYREEYATTDRGTEVLCSYVSDCCRAETFNGPKDTNEYRRILISYLHNMPDSELFKWLDSCPVEEVLDFEKRKEIYNAGVICNT